MFKFGKVLTLVMSIMLVLTMVACSNDDKDKLEEAKSALLLSETSNVVDDITLPAKGKHDVVITWSSDNTDVIGNDGKVTRPENGEGDAVVTLIATLKLGKEETTKEFRVRVLEMPEEAGITVAGVLAETKGTPVVLKNVIVFGIVGDGYYVYDETGHMFVFTQGEPSDVVKVGDKINVYGEYDIYYGQPQLTKPNGYEVISSGNDLPNPVVTDIATIVDYDTEVKTIFSSYLTVEGTVVLQGQYNNVFIKDDAGNQLEINYKSNESDVKAFEGKRIKVDLVLHTFRTDSQSWRMSFVGTADDITEVTVSEEDQLQTAYDGLTLPSDVYESLNLRDKLGNVSISWESSNLDVISNDGVVTRPNVGEADVEVTLTATLKLNELTETKVFNVTVKAEQEVKGDSTDLFISEYIEGSSFNKAIEIYNGTGQDVDLSNYKLVLYINGSSSDTRELVLSGTLKHGEVFVLAHAQANDAIIAQADITDSNVINHNGNDPFGLFKGDELIDLIGTIGSDADFAKDTTLVRNPNVKSGSTEFNENEWTSHSNNTTDYLGSHVVE